MNDEMRRSVILDTDALICNFTNNFLKRPEWLGKLDHNISFTLAEEFTVSDIFPAYN